jgi:hypothetical protein
MDMTLKSVARGILFAIGSFLILGTAAALWPNPFFMRMTPTSGFEVALLAVQSLLLGVYLAIPMPACATKLAGIGGVANFLGVACPICNKVLLFLFGAQVLLTYLEPVRIYIAAAGALITAIAVVVRWRRFRASTGGSVLAARATS